MEKRFWKALQTSRPTSELAQGFKLTYGLWSGGRGGGWLEGLEGLAETGVTKSEGLYHGSDRGFYRASKLYREFRSCTQSYYSEC